jgi:hypothetical protein
MPLNLISEILYLRDVGVLRNVVYQLKGITINL